MNDVVFLLNLTYAALHPIVSVLATVGPDSHSDELIAGIPLEGAVAVAGETAIRVVREHFSD